jgi:AcrR family transcriptional regulator
MLEIIHSGEAAPSAELVAQRADVGLRTVFRHFQDMDSLYREMSKVIVKELHAAAETPFKSQDWRERVVELIARRSWAFEKVGPFLRASAVFRYRSKFLDADNVDFASRLRAILKAQLPQEVARDQLKVEVLDLLLGFEAWSRLRRDQGLTPKRAREVLEAAVRRLLE